ncbi:phasin family protein [Qipengyuania sediminis]|uniref:phasin family protein n=1 Tax=Qipengyuania sediminis TaxID=1532023 RepID=UPI00105A00D6|nr:phasin family protein [Qipengyuania sediminis]
MSDTLQGLPRGRRAKAGKALAPKAALLAGVAQDVEAAAIASELHTDGPAAEAAPAIAQSIKETTMETMNTTENAAGTATGMGADMQSRAKAAFDKTAEMTADLTAFHKGNVEALVEAGKVLATNLQDLGRSALEDARSAAETATADVKAMAAVKSPTELFQLQGEIMRRNVDAMVARTSHNAEAMMKLANDIFAPLSTRASVAMERFNKAA